LKGAAWHGREQGRDGLVVSAIEHHAVLDPARWLGRQGFRVAEAGVDRDGVVRTDLLEAALDSKTAVVSVMSANNEIGTVQRIAGFGAAVAHWVEHRSAWARSVGALRDRLQRRITESLDRVRVQGEAAERLPNNLHLIVEGIDGESLILLLDAAGIAASQGSA